MTRPRPSSHRFHFLPAISCFALLATGPLAFEARAQGITDKSASLPRQTMPRPAPGTNATDPVFGTCLLYTSDAADE